MIEFCGIYSEKSKNYIHKRTIKNLCFWVAAIVLVLSAPLIILGVIKDFLVFAIPGVAVIFIFGAVFIFDTIKTVRARNFAKIVIKDGIINLYCEKPVLGNQSRAKNSVSTWEKDRLFQPVSGRTIKLRFQTTLAVEDGKIDIDEDNPHKTRLISHVKKAVDMGGMVQSCVLFRI